MKPSDELLIINHDFFFSIFRYHISDEEGLRRDMTDMYVHVVNQADNLITPPEEVLAVVDANYDTLAKVYIDAGIQRIVPAASTESSSPSFIEFLDPNLAALIALLIVLFIGAVLFSILCCCIKNWAFAAAAAKATKPQKMAPGKSKFLEIFSFLLKIVIGII